MFDITGGQGKRKLVDKDGKEFTDYGDNFQSAAKESFINEIIQNHWISILRWILAILAAGFLAAVSAVWATAKWTGNVENKLISLTTDTEKNASALAKNVKDISDANTNNLLIKKDLGVILDGQTKNTEKIDKIFEAITDMRVQQASDSRKPVLTRQEQPVENQ